MKNCIYSEKVISLIQDVLGKNLSKPVPIHEPNFADTNALRYLKDCIDTGWVSTNGLWVERFEKEICKFTCSKYAVAVSNGTVALRLALFLMGVKPSEEVIIPPLTFVGTANAVSHLGAIPHFVDIDPFTLGLCPKALQERLDKVAILKNGQLINKITGNRISAIVPVHVFGNPCQIIRLKEISSAWNIPLVEDAAEALGSWQKDGDSYKHCGLFGEISIISFNGNKIITTGGGGVLITSNKELAFRAKHLSTTAKIPHKWELAHDEIGWNDRLPNLNAALGVSQMETLKTRLDLKKRLFTSYQEILSDFDGLELLKTTDGSKSNNWLISLRITNQDQLNAKKVRDQILNFAYEKGFLLRPSWKLLSQLKMYKNCPSSNLQNAIDQNFRIINLPSSPQLMK